MAINTNISEFSLSPGKITDENPVYDAMGIRLIALLRVSLAISGLLLMESFQSPIGQHAMTTATVVLFSYVIYSALIYGLVFHREHLLHSRWWHWGDMAWWLAAIASTGGGHSVFYLFFIYPIIVASFRWGTNEGIAISIAAVASLLLVALADLGGSTWPGQWQGVLLRAVTLLVLGYVIALWAGFEALQKKRLALLSELNRLPNPRFGPDRLIAITLERLCDFYRADNCIAVLSATDGSPSIHQARTALSGTAVARTPAGILGVKLLSLPEHCAVTYKPPSLWARLTSMHIRIDGARDREQRALIRSCSHVLAHELDAGSWISIPLQLRDAVLGRLYLLSRYGHFGMLDICLLRQAMDKFMPLVETVKLLDGWATEAAEKERRKISLDLHDGAIQPYLGLKLGLESLRRKIDRHNVLAADLDDLYRMTTDSIAELRGYVGVLEASPQPTAVSLMDGLQRQVDKFRGFYGLNIEVNALSDIVLNDRLAAEVLQMIGESLSNIGRHTASLQVTINLSRQEDCLVTQIINYGENYGEKDDTAWQCFTPVSLTKRAQYLGGNVEVARHANGGTEVQVTIPL